MISSIVLAVSGLSAVALLLGLFIFLVSRKFHVEEDPLVGIITVLLPGVNCGACGYPGCANLASVLVKTRDPSKICPVGGEALMQQVGQTLGIKMAETRPIVCRVLCQGTFAKANRTANYQGIQDCRAAVQIFSGTKKCPFACVGLGSCIAVCQYGALRIVDGLIDIIEDRCVGCGACVQECPKEVLILHEKREKCYTVACRSTDKGVITRKYCSVGCIGCMKCVKTCEYDAIKVENFCAVIDRDKCTSCGACIDVCPTGSIVLNEDLKRDRATSEIVHSFASKLPADPEIPGKVPGEPAERI